MGMNLITIGWTARASDYDDSAVTTALAAITNDWLHENAENLDPNGLYATPIGDELCYILAEIRIALETGATDYAAHMDRKHRCGTSYDVPNGDALVFYVAGGGTYGDDPYEGWTELGMFLDACDRLPELAAAAGFFGGGIQL